jgi:hypothetical protein
MGAEGDLAGADAVCGTLIEGYETLRAGLDRLLAPSAGEETAILPPPG